VQALPKLCGRCDTLMPDLMRAMIQIDCKIARIAQYWMRVLQDHLPLMTHIFSIDLYPPIFAEKRFADKCCEQTLQMEVNPVNLQGLHLPTENEDLQDLLD
jgi:hypothetical protein